MRTDELTIDDGLVAFKVNGGKATLTFNPTDMTFFEKIYKAMVGLAEKQKQYDQGKKEMSDAEVFDFGRKVNNEMRELIDSVLVPVSDVESVCDAVFGDMNLWAAGNGCHVWENTLLAIIDKADDSIKQQETLRTPRMNKYTKKYHK